MEILVGLFLWVLFGVFSAMIASTKGRSAGGWFFMGLIFGPFGLLVALLPATEKSGATRKCPDCAEVVKAEAMVCKHCGKKFDIAAESVSVSPQTAQNNRQPG